jgi:periplasmic protein TonB
MCSSGVVTPANGAYREKGPNPDEGMATLTPGYPKQPELNLLRATEVTERSTLGSLFANIRDALFPPKEAPLHLTSKPVKVRDIWGEYNYKKKGATFSTVAHAALIGSLIAVSIIGARVKPVEQPKQSVTELVMPADLVMPITPKKQDTLAGGGGGGDRDKLQAPKGKLPKLAMEQITPPAMVIRNEHPKLEVEPTVVMPPQVKLPMANNMPNLGDPMTKLPSGPASNGIGSGGGIGSGSGGGIGAGEGPGVGPGRGGGFGGGVFKVGGGVSAPKAVDTPDPEYSEEARKAKYQGTVLLWLIVGPDGKPRDIKVSRALGMGLDQKAIEAVRKWKFAPAEKDGRPVAVQINVEVNFKLY